VLCCFLRIDYIDTENIGFIGFGNWFIQIDGDSNNPKEMACK